MTMKTLMWAVIGIGIVGGGLLCLTRWGTRPPASAVQPADFPPVEAVAEPQPASAAHPDRQEQPPGTARADRPTQLPPKPQVPAAATADDPAAVKEAVETLASPTSTFEEKQTAWHAFPDTNRLTHAITELERMTRDESASAQCHAALGQAYLRKCGMIQDVREQGILAMQADKVFDTALELDPSNWDARFTKAVAMSYWPEQLNRRDEVVEQFCTLIEQQETQPQQPHFAMSYLQLGQQYQQAGYPDLAQQVWQRGAALFPGNEDLRTKLAAP